MFELINSDTSPLESALYDPVTGELDLVFDWDKMLQSEGVWGNIRHIDAIVFNGTPYEIEIHSDDGPDGEYLYAGCWHWVFTKRWYN